MLKREHAHRSTEPSFPGASPAPREQPVDRAISYCKPLSPHTARPPARPPTASLSECELDTVGEPSEVYLILVEAIPYSQHFALTGDTFLLHKNTCIHSLRAISAADANGFRRLGRADLGEA